MRIWPISDLHTEFGRRALPYSPPDADVCVVAGDVGVGGILPALDWLERNIAHRLDVVFVAGNHDFWRTDHMGSLRAARTAADRYPNIHLLENNAVTLGEVTFLGCTLWTDYSLAGSQPLSMYEASRDMKDFKRIKFTKRPFARFSPFHAAKIHRDSRAFLRESLGRATGTTVVVTHHAPSARSLPSRFEQDPLRASYASDLEQLVLEYGPDLWIHGHIHDPVDYRIGRTRVFSNPFGYPDEFVRRVDAGQVVLEL